MNKETGGPAFPVTVMEYNIDAAAREPTSQGGMTLRDYFAAKAMQGIEAAQGNAGEFICPLDAIAKRAYDIADAMLQARKS